MEMSISLISVLGMGVILVWHFFNVIKIQPVKLVVNKETTFSEDVVIGAVKSGVSNSYLECETAEKVLTLFYVFSSNKNLGSLSDEIANILNALISKNFKVVVSSLITIWNKLDNIELAQNKAKKRINTIC